MLLRASSNATDREVDLASAVGQGSAVGVDHGDLLLRYAEIANRDPSEASALADEMLAAVGPAALSTRRRQSPSSTDLYDRRTQSVSRLTTW